MLGKQFYTEWGAKGVQVLRDAIAPYSKTGNTSRSIEAVVSDSGVTFKARPGFSTIEHVGKGHDKERDVYTSALEKFTEEMSIAVIEAETKQMIDKVMESL